MRTRMKKKMTTNQIIAKEGYKPLGFSLFFLLFLYIIDSSSIIFFLFSLLSLFIAYIYRNGERIQEDDCDDVYISPIDGKVISIESKDDFIEIEISHGICDSHLLRAPYRGEIVDKMLLNGAGLPLKHQNSKTVNQRAKIDIKSEERVVGIEMLSSIFTKSLNIYKNIQSHTKRGERIGFFLYGKVFLKLPSNTRVKVNVGDEVKSGVSTIGYIS